MRPRSSILAMGLCAALLLGACKASTEAPSSPADGPAAVPDATEKPAPTPVSPEIAEALAAMHDRHQCNRVMGCSPAVRLFQHGKAAVPAMLSDIERNSRNPDYATLKLVDLLGQLDDDRALPTLHGLLSTGRWEVRGLAALAVGRLRRQASREEVDMALERATPEKDKAVRTALLLAAERLRLPIRPVPREQLTALLTIPEKEAAQLSPGPYSFMLRVVREARLHGGLPLTRLGATHINRFIRLEALQTLGALRDTAGIPFCVSRLDDPLPSVRRTALGCLQQITGTHTRTDPDAWRAWCDDRNCRETFRADQPSEGDSGGASVDAPD